MADYPDSIYTPRTIANREGVVYDSTKTKVYYAEDSNNSNAEIVAVQEILGLNPEGTFTSVVDRLDDFDDQLSDLAVTDGWKPASVQPTLIDSDDPNFTLRFDADVTGIFSKGMRIKFTQNGAVVYFIIVAVGAYSGTNTDVMVYGGTDYNVLNSSTYPISLCKYSGEKAPFGFPLATDKWTVQTTITANVTVTNPDTSWNNISYIDIPVGAWQVSYSGSLQITDKNSRDYVRGIITLSKGATTEDDLLFTRAIHNRATYSSSYGLIIESTVTADKFIELTTEDRFYLNVASQYSMTDGSVLFRATTSNAYIKAVCAYL